MSMKSFELLITLEFTLESWSDNSITCELKTEKADNERM